MDNIRNDPRWRAGYQARDEGWGMEHNPYPGDSEHFAIWHDGWITCEEDYNPLDMPEDID